MHEETRREVLYHIEYLETLLQGLKVAVVQLCSEDANNKLKAFYNLGLTVENLGYNIDELREDLNREEDCDPEDEFGERTEDLPRDDEYVSFESLKTVIDKLLKERCCGQKN